MKPERVQFELSLLSEWRLEDDAQGFAQGNQAINRLYHLKDNAAASKFAVRVCEIAQRHAHFPEISVDVNRVFVRLTTPEAGGLTEKDFDMAVLFEHAYLTA